jgi:hypothetical protein
MHQSIHLAEGRESIRGEFFHIGGLFQAALAKSGVLSPELIAEGDPAHGISTMQNDSCSLLDEASCHVLTDAGGAARDEDDLVLESHEWRGAEDENERPFLRPLCSSSRIFLKKVMPKAMPDASLS